MLSTEVNADFSVINSLNDTCYLFSCMYFLEGLVDSRFIKDFLFGISSVVFVF